MILETKEEFERAVLDNEEIKHKTVFYTQDKDLDILRIAPVAFINNTFSVGQPYYVNGKIVGIVAGRIDKPSLKKTIVLSLHDEPEKMDWNEANAINHDGFRFPSKEEFHAIFPNLDDVNKALIKNNGEAFNTNDWYWSSTEYTYSYCAWGLRPSDGYLDWANKYYTVYVRCVLAF